MDTVEVLKVCYDPQKKFNYSLIFINDVVTSTFNCGKVFLNISAMYFSRYKYNVYYFNSKHVLLVYYISCKPIKLFIIPISNQYL